MKYGPETIIGKDTLVNDFDYVEELLSTYGKLIIINDNKVYELSVTNANDLKRTTKEIERRTTRPKAMIMVLQQDPNHTMHAKDIAE